MGFADFYFERLKDFKVKINTNTRKDLKYIVVIPCFNEFFIIRTLNSLWDCKRTGSLTEVIVVINSAEDTGQEILDQNNKTYNEVKDWIENHEDPLLHFFVLHEANLPKKYAGAGLARKIGMDQAIWRFNTINQDQGVIVSLDADTLVELTYFAEIDKVFSSNLKANVASVYFEHPLCGNEFVENVYDAIATYELYLRYYKLALNYMGFPYYYYTIGSCFTVKAKAYIKQGGMNKKRAGEDFYFLHKIFPLGYTVEINTTCVYPSPRPSDRVPFGTGPMVSSLVKSGSKDFFTYNFESFLELKSLFSKIDALYKISKISLDVFLKELPECISEFLIQNSICNTIEEINGNCSNLISFKKRFFDWFTAFKVLKYLNFAHTGYYAKKPLLHEVNKLICVLGLNQNNEAEYLTYLKLLRKIEKQF